MPTEVPEVLGPKLDPVPEAFKVPTLDLLAKSQHCSLLSGASQRRPRLVEQALDWESSRGRSLALALYLPGCVTLATSIHT